MAATNDGGEDVHSAVRRFAKFFRAYALGLSLVTASFPPILGYFDVLPMFASIKGYITGLTSLGSYLLVAFVFSIRHVLAKIWFPGHREGGVRTASPRELRRMAALNVLPGVLILVSLTLFVIHMWVVHNAVHRIAYEYAVAVPEPDSDRPVRDMLGSATTRVVRGRLAFHESGIIRISYRTNDDKSATLSDVQFPSEGYVQALLKETPSASIPGLLLLTAPFLLAFLCAVAAFVLMGLKDYVQEVLGIRESAVLSNVS